MIAIINQTEEEQRQMYLNTPKEQLVEMLIESNKHLNRLFKTPKFLIGEVCDFYCSDNSTAMNCNNCGHPHFLHNDKMGG